MKTWGYKNLDAFKNDKDVYEFLNTGKRSFEKMLNAIRVQEKLVRNRYEKTFGISIKKELNWKERTIDAPKTFPNQRREPSDNNDEND